MFCFVAPDELTVPQNSDAVADTENLVHLVRNVNDRYILPTQPLDLIEQGIDLPLGNCRGRFVHDDDLCAYRNRLDDFDQLTLRHAQIPHIRQCVNRDVHILEQLARLRDHAPFIDPAHRCTQLASHEHVLEDHHILYRIQLLMDH